MSDSTPAQPESGDVDLHQLLRGQLALELTDGQVATLAQRHGLTAPVGSWLGEPTEATDADERVLGDLGIVEDGQPSDWFLALWRTVTAPVFLVAVDRLLDGKTAEWLYLVDQQTFAEQVKTVAGWTWLFGVHEELLARVLLNIGLLRITRDHADLVTDPFPSAESWTAAVTFIERAADGSPSPRCVRCGYDGNAWSRIAADGSSEAATRVEVGELVATLLGADVGA